MTSAGTATAGPGDTPAVEPLLELRGVEKVYGREEAEVRALRGVSLRIEPGEFVAVMGTSGSGKSTSMNVIGGLDRPTAGSYRFRGVEVTELDLDQLALLRRTYLGFVFQGFNLLARTTALENVELPLVYRGVPAEERAERARAALASVGLAGREGHTPAELSGGQQQRVAIARALVTDPILLLADEPTGNLDSARKDEIMRLLVDLNRQRGISILMVTHEPDMARYASRIVHFRDGQIESDQRVEAPTEVSPAAADASPPRPAPSSEGLASPLLSAFGMALRAIRRNVLRSSLTALGIVIGVGAVIAMVTLGQGATERVTSDVSSLGNNMLTVMPGSSRRGPVSSSAAPLTREDLRAIQEQVSGLGALAPSSSRGVLVVAGNRNYNTTAHGSTNEWVSIRNWKLASGRLFSETELNGGLPACILGTTVQKQLFGSQDPLGASLRVGAVSCTVVGVFASKGRSTFGEDQDDLLLMPLTTFQRRLAGKTTIDSILVSVAPGRSSERVTARLQQLLRERRRIAPGAEDDFSVRDMKEMAQALSSVTTTLTALLGGIAAVSLVVGGIGIMNIMLVSVTERTREIGTRLAIGALGHEVMMQFLVEAVVLSLLGGTAGVLLGLSGSFAATRALNLPFVVLPGIVIVAFVFSAFVGVAFGYLPARKAASLNPIDALRHE